jgi:Mg2+-importing ATPase
VSSDLDVAAQSSIATVLTECGSRPDGLSSAEAQRRLAEVGPNALRAHEVPAWAILSRQFRNPLLLLLLAAATVSGLFGQGTDAIIIAGIVSLSIGLGFFNEFRSEQAVEALHRQIKHTALVQRDGAPKRVDVVDLVPGDIVSMSVGDVVPADLRLLDEKQLSCDEAVLTGESLPAEKTCQPVERGTGSCALMGTVVRTGSGVGVVVATGPRTSFGRIAAGLGERHAETAFQVGLHQFSVLLVRVAAVLTASIFVLNVLLHGSLLEALLFSLAIAIGITPQLLPAIVTVSLSTGSRRLARRKVLVKRLVSIEDLGNIAVLFTDKTGTLTEGHITFDRALDAAGAPAARAHLLGLVCNEATTDDAGHVMSGNQLDTALWEGAPAAIADAAHAWKRVDVRPFDHERRVTTVVADAVDGQRLLIVKGEPEGVLRRCAAPPPTAAQELATLSRAGSRIIALATRSAPGLATVTDADERDLEFASFLVFADRPKADAAASLARLAQLGIEVKVITGDSEAVAVSVCSSLGLDVRGALTGDEVDAMSDGDLAARIDGTTVFARIGPETKARIVQLKRVHGADVAFMGDGVNDALALHHADVGISVDSGTDVAKDAADIILLDKDLGVLADGVTEGRRIFANTIKYVLMATSSNFGNMFSAAVASAFLSFLPMLPSQILLNNVLYDIGQTTIPTDRVDPEMLARPSAWDVKFIRRFMTFFGPISSIFDFATFGILLGVLHAHAAEFRTGWFVESLATQSLVIFAIRTRRSPFWRSRPSRPLLVASLAVPLVGVALPYMPFGHSLGFTHLPAVYYPMLVALVVTYLALVEVGKVFFYRHEAAGTPLARRRPYALRRIHRRASHFTTAQRPPPQQLAGAGSNTTSTPRA